ncbi:MAG TPA: hypothetical protein DCQ98_13085 [Planctomycetaceae bacterium]|nr:hypothetical protein [Planctomycetaceae bacterium]HRE99882.1 TraR/DksA C4-type zinc finger protein [Pirellulaceae bacterium]
MESESPEPGPLGFVLLRCRTCGDETRLRWVELLSRLREAGLFRRNDSPGWDEVRAIVPHHLDTRHPCRACDAERFEVVSGEDDDEWEAIRRCVVCRKAIDPERLEALPDAVSCRDCKEGANRANDQHCPRCGEVLAWESRTSGNRYRQSCRGCGWRSG